LLFSLEYLILCLDPINKLLLMLELGHEHLLELLLLSIATDTVLAVSMLLEAILLLEPELGVIKGELLILDGDDAGLPTVCAAARLLDGKVAAGFQLFDQLPGFLLVESVHRAQVRYLLVLLLRQFRLGPAALLLRIQLEVGVVLLSALHRL
jgi:hypothetical protein